MKLIKLLLLSLTLLLALPAAPQNAASNIAASAPTAVPPLIPYSGVVNTIADQRSPANAGVTFEIYKDEVGGEALWTETQTVAVDSIGHYKVQLGAANPNGLPADLFASGEARWLEVQVAGEPPQPRVLLVSVPYALKAADAATLGGLPPSAFALARPASEAGAAVSPAIMPNVTSNVTTTGGTLGFVPKFSGTSSVVDSPIFVGSTGAVGIGTTTPTATLTLDGTMTVTGTSTLNGQLLVLSQGAATASQAFNSQIIKLSSSAFNSSSHSVVSPRFQLQVEPTGNDTASPSGTLNLLSSMTSSAPAETGFFINANGTIHFAPGQTFPGGTGTGTITGVTAGTGLTGGGTSGHVTLNVDTTKVPLLSSANTFGATQALSSGDLSLGSTFNATSGVINIGGVPFLHGFSKGNQNVFVGGAGNFTTTGTATAATGFGALAAQTSGKNNTAAGADALASVTTGSSNTGLGVFAGPTGGALSNTTAVGANAKVGQSNSLVLGQTTAGSPGASHVSVGIGTATPISALEVAVSNTGALGPVLTLTNPGGDNTSTFTDGAAAIDFNTTAVSTSGTYNPGARIEAVDDGVHSTDINFLSNIYGGGSGTANGGLQTNMTVFGLSGTVSIGTNEAQSQLEVIGTTEEGVWAFGGNEPDFGMQQGLNGLRAGGGFSTGTDTGGIGAWLFGGDSDAGTTGEGLLVWTGESNSGPTGLAADFEGDVFVDGTLSANTKEFKIDHPLDPANKYLVHASVESSEMMNIYSGNVTTDELGLATVTLPDWFQAENTNFRYQLTVVDERFAQAIVSKRIENNQFTIHTNATNVQVSWQITAVRQDAYAKAHPMVVEQLKGDKERGFYQHPELYGQPKEKQTQWGVHPAMVRQLAADKKKLKEGRSKSGTKVDSNPQVQPSAPVVNHAQLN